MAYDELRAIVREYPSQEPVRYGSWPDNTIGDTSAKFLIWLRLLPTYR